MNTDGYITRSELFIRTKSLADKPTPDEIEEVLEEVDIDGDGKICYVEFVIMMQKKEGVMVAPPKEAQHVKHVFESLNTNLD